MCRGLFSDFFELHTLGVIILPCIFALKTLSILVNVLVSMQIIMTLFLVKMHFLVFVSCNQSDRNCCILRIFIHWNSELPQQSLTDFSLKSVQCRVAPPVLTDFVAKSVKASKFFGDTKLRFVDLNHGQLWLIYVCAPWFYFTMAEMEICVVYLYCILG